MSPAELSRGGKTAGVWAKAVRLAEGSVLRLVIRMGCPGWRPKFVTGDSRIALHHDIVNHTSPPHLNDADTTPPSCDRREQAGGCADLARPPSWPCQRPLKHNGCSTSPTVSYLSTQPANPRPTSLIMSGGPGGSANPAEAGVRASPGAWIQGPGTRVLGPRGLRGRRAAPP